MGAVAAAPAAPAACPRQPRRGRSPPPAPPGPSRLGAVRGAGMRLRPRQRTFVERSLAALDAHGNTLGVAPTGAGKTIMLSAVTGEMIGDERRQGLRAGAPRRADRAEPREVRSASIPGSPPRSSTPRRSPGPARSPSPWCRRSPRAANLAAMPALDLLVIDEAHHAVADSYRRIIDRARDANPDVPHLRRHRDAEPRRPQGPARGLRQCRRPGPARRADRLRPPGAAAHLRHRCRRAGRSCARSARPPPTSTWRRWRGS